MPSLRPCGRDFWKCLMSSHLQKGGCTLSHLRDRFFEADLELRSRRQEAQELSSTHSSCARHSTVAERHCRVTLAPRALSLRGCTCPFSCHQPLARAEVGWNLPVGRVPFSDERSEWWGQKVGGPARSSPATETSISGHASRAAPVPGALHTSGLTCKWSGGCCVAVLT